jgi:hypothetical protein
MELLVRIVDKTSADPASNIQLTKRGDVIAYHEDGGEWGTAERSNPEWIILGVTGMTTAQADSLLQPETPPADNPQQPVMKRLYALDLDAMGSVPVVRATGTAPDYVVPVAEVQANVIQKPPSVDPSTIGPTRTTIIGPQ